MKRFTDYNVTEKEILCIFGSKDSYEFCLEDFKKDPESDYEKLNIASLLSLRGEHEESLNMINSIKDAGYRETCLQLYASWGAGNYKIIN